MIILIAAMAHNRVIGYQNKMPWHIPNELAHFRRTTQGQTVLMGRKTFDAIGGPLPHRHNIIVTSKPLSLDNKEVTITGDLLGTLKDWQKKDQPLYVIGGGQIYESALPYADEIILTVVKGDYQGDTYFPAFSSNDFILIKQDYNPEFNVFYYKRRT